MKSSPIVSVVIPAFNAEKFLLETVQSVLAQTLPDLEVIIVNDGSTDGTLEIAKSISDTRVTVLSGPNRGIGHARNAGLRAVRSSSFIGFLDSDDLWDPEKLRIQVEWLRAHPRTIAAGCYMRYVSAQGRPLGQTGQRIMPKDLELIKRARFLPFPISSCLFRKTVMDRLGGFDEHVCDVEDLELYARAARVGELECVPRILGSYRIHSGSASVQRRASLSLKARFVQHRLEARDAGADLSWDEFTKNYRPRWGEKRLDLVNTWYRAAGLRRLQGENCRAACLLTLAALAGPRYTFPRLYRHLFGW